MTEVFYEDKELKTYQRTAIHSACGGKMVHDGGKLLSNPPQYPHTCEKCGHRENLKSSYPTTVYEYVDKEKS